MTKKRVQWTPQERETVYRELQEQWTNRPTLIQKEAWEEAQLALSRDRRRTISSSNLHTEMKKFRVWEKTHKAKPARVTGSEIDSLPSVRMIAFRLSNGRRIAFEPDITLGELATMGIKVQLIPNGK